MFYTVGRTVRGRLTAEEEGGGEVVYEHREALTFLVCCVHRKQADREQGSRDRKDEFTSCHQPHSVIVNRKYN